MLGQSGVGVQAGQTPPGREERHSGLQALATLDEIRGVSECTRAPGEHWPRTRGLISQAPGLNPKDSKRQSGMELDALGYSELWKVHE